LLSESLEYETILERIGNLAVPKLADWYSIDVVDEGDKIRTLAFAQSGPEKAPLSHYLADRYPEGPEPRGGVPKVLATGNSELYAEGEQAGDPVTAMVVPLVARGRVFGAMTFLSVNPEHRYGDVDLSMAEDLARRAAMAIDNANLYKQAQSAIRARDEFLSIASHELRTPLTPLKIQTQGLMRALRAGNGAEVDPQKVTRMLEISDRQIGRLSRLIDDLLDISRISIGRLTLNVEEFDVNELLTEIIERFRDQLAVAECRVDVHQSGPLMVRWDRLRIEQVIVNLLVNALKYGPGKPISIELNKTDDRALLSFRDHGIGIAKEDQSRIFGRFERAVSGSHFGGLGLGLYIVTQILSAHGGDIGVESEQGAGSRFTVSLPFTVSTEPGAALA
jgi:signal transduction histidine kinase